MPTKVGAGGHQQNYDSHGRYCRKDHFSLEPPKLSKKETARRKEEKRRQGLFERAKNSKDKYLFDVYLALEQNFPGIVLGVNTIKYDKNIEDNREFDIIAEKSIIEIKGEVGKKCGKQFLAQKKYAEDNNKNYYVYAPKMNDMRTYTYSKLDITICRTLEELISKFKENRK